MTLIVSAGTETAALLCSLLLCYVIN